MYKVVEAVVIIIRFSEVITWPENVMDAVLRFRNIFEFPQVIGYVDGTLIKIIAPKEN